jgi:hypothetical protein
MVIKGLVLVAPGAVQLTVCVYICVCEGSTGVHVQLSSVLI